MRVPSGGYSCAFDGDFIKRLTSGVQHYGANAQVDHPANNDIAVGRRDLAAIPTSIQHMRRSHAGTRSHEAVENDVADVGEGFNEELHEGARERRRMRSLAALGFNLDYIRWPRDAGKAAVAIVGTQPSSRGPARARAEETAAGGGFGVVWRVIETVLGDVPHSLRPELDLGLAGEMEDRLPTVLEAVRPATRGSPIALDPA